MPEEKKKAFRIENGELVIEFAKSFDPNKDNEAVAEVALVVRVDLAEIPDEIVDAWTARKKDKAE